MRTLIFLSTILAIAVNPACADQIDKDKLRTAARMPNAFASSTTGFTIEELCKKPVPWFGPEASVAERIARLEQAVKEHADDADAHYHLGLLRHMKGELVSAGRSFDKAAELYKARLQARPDDGRALAGLGLALKGRKAKVKEAEALLRKAVTVAPGDSECWLALHVFLTYKASLPYFEGVTSKIVFEAESSAQLEEMWRADVALMEQLFAEADQCLDKAVACAPRDPKVYTVRGIYYGSSRFELQTQIATAKGGSDQPDLRAVTAANAAAWADFHKAALLSPQDPHALGMTILSAGLLRPLTHEPENKTLLEAMPATARKLLEADIAELKKLAASADRSTSAPAWAYLATAQWDILGQPKEAEASIRQALRLNPQDESCWEWLYVRLSGETNRWQDILVASEERLKFRDSASNRFLAAEAHVNLKQFDRAEEHVRIALRQEPDNARILLGLAALLLRRSANEGVLKEAGACLDQAQEKLKNVNAELLIRWDPDSDLLPVDVITVKIHPDAGLRMADYNLLRGIHLALTGNVAEARRRLGAVRTAVDFRYEEAQAAALKALGGAARQ